MPVTFNADCFELTFLKKKRQYAFIDTGILSMTGFFCSKKDFMTNDKNQVPYFEAKAK